MKNPFTIPADTKITDKAFSRVLFSLICSILLCMGCLAGTTWAWFVASIENEGNVITIASVTTDVVVYQDDVEVLPAEDGSYTLPLGDYAVQVSVTNSNPASQRAVYVLMTVTQNDVEQWYYLPFADGVTEANVALTVTNADATVRFATRWAQPVATLIEDAVTLTGEAVADSTTPTEPTTPTDTDSTDPTDSTTSTEVTETTDTTETTETTESTTSTETTETTTTTEDVETTTTTEVTTTTTESTTSTEAETTTTTQPSDPIEE